MATPEWQAWQLASAGSVEQLAKNAERLATNVKSTLTLAEQGMTLVKILAQLQGINPLLIALDALAEEILDEIANLKEAGYYYLYVDPYYVKNVTPKPAFVYGWEQTRSEGGKLLWKLKEIDSDGDWTGQTRELPHTDSFPTKEQLDPTLPKDELGNTEPYAPLVEPLLSTPRKLIPGGFNPYGEPWIDPLPRISPYPQFSTEEVINEFVKAFEDPGDVPRYKALSSAPKAGTIVYDKDGEAYSDWNKSDIFGVALFDKGKVHESSGEVKDFKAAAKPVNIRLSSGKPNIGGQTEYAGGSGKSAAIAIIIGAPSFQVFADTFNAFSKMFTDIPELAAATGKSLFDSLMDIQFPNEITVKLTQVDTNYGTFENGDVIGGDKYGGLAEITEVNTASITFSSMTTRKTVVQTDDAGNLKQVTVDIDNNPDGRWLDMEVKCKPIRSVDGLNPFIVGDNVYEQEIRGEGGIIPHKFPNYVNKGQGTVNSPHTDRIYPKCGKVGTTKLTELPKSVQPDFAALKMEAIVPYWGEFFQLLENFVKQIQEMISDSVAFIDDMIEMIKGVEKFLEDLVKTIEEFLEFFSISLPSTGVYALHIPDQAGGNDGLKQAIKQAEGLPDLGYAAGVLFVGTKLAGTQPIDLLAEILQLKEQSGRTDEIIRDF